MTEIDIASDQENAERGGTADTDLQLESEQRAIQPLYDYQNAARTARETARQRVPLPALQIYSDLPIGNGRWRGLLSPASKLIASSVHFSGGGLQNKHSEAPPLLTFRMKSTRPI